MELKWWLDLQGLISCEQTSQPAMHFQYWLDKEVYRYSYTTTDEDVLSDKKSKCSSVDVTHTEGNPTNSDLLLWKIGQGGIVLSQVCGFT